MMLEHEHDELVEIEESNTGKDVEEDLLQPGLVEHDLSQTHARGQAAPLSCKKQSEEHPATGQRRIMKTEYVMKNGKERRVSVRRRVKFDDTRPQR